MIHHLPLSARFAELDPYGHVNHAVYVGWCEEGRVAALRSIGLDLHELADAGHQFVVTELELRYRRPALAGDQVVVETSVARLRRVSSQWNQRIVREGEELVSARLTAGLTDTGGRPSRPPAWINERLAALVEPAGG